MYFTLPEALRDQFGQDEAVLTEHVKTISGLNGLIKGPDVTAQKFMGTNRTFLNPKLDDTSYEISVTFTLNLRNGVDNYIFKLFRAWNQLGYDLSTGETRLKRDYIADWLKISIGNRQGDIYREIIFKDVILFGGIEANDDLDYESNDLVELTVKFKSDWAKELNA